MNELNPQDFIITRKRKKYRFALFYNNPLCFELDDWQTEFVPTIVEIGAGTGTFSVALAGRMPNERYLAVDVKADRLQTGAELANEQKLTNIRFLRARVEQLDQVAKPHSLGAIWITFPDPFSKDRSSKHRLTYPKSLELYRRLLKPGGRIHFKTDAVALFDWSLEQLADAGWKIRTLSFDLHRSNASDVAKITTSYEMRYIGEGKRICYVEAEPPSL